MKIERLQELVELDRFLEAFEAVSGHWLPSDYLWKQEVWAIVDENKEIHGGFALITDVPFRTIEQIPRSSRPRVDGTLAEITCFFNTQRQKSLSLIVFILMRALNSGKKRFIFSFDEKNLALENYYSAGDYRTIYTGPVYPLENASQEETRERVGYITVFGILKILRFRTCKYIRNKLKRSFF